jgi:hypothetical protein
MNSAEYVAVLISIVIGLALTDVLQSLHRLLRAGRGVKWDWAAPLSTLLVVMVLVMLWWAFYQPAAGRISIGEFLPTLGTLVLLFLLAASALPDEVPAEGLDLRDYYQRNGRYLWTLFAGLLAWLLLVDVGNALAHGRPLQPVLRGSLVEVAVLALLVSLAVVRRRWWHAFGLVVLLGSGPAEWLARAVG